MGWMTDGHPEHEGYMVGIVKVSDGRYRELGLEDAKRERVQLAEVQVGCDCGWRSSRLMAPSGTYWSPFMVMLPSEAHEDRALLLWKTHLAMTAKREALIMPAPKDIYGKPRDPRCMCASGATSSGHDVRCPAYRPDAIRHRRDPVMGKTTCCGVFVDRLPAEDEITNVPEMVNCHGGNSRVTEEMRERDRRDGAMVWRDDAFAQRPSRGKK